jgi:hypothetical protein
MSKPLTKEIFCNALIGSISIKVDSVYQDSSDCVYYKVTLTIEDCTHEVGRRFNQFKEFDKTLRYHFPGTAFPSLPSKFVIFHKIEQRKRGFNAYMNGLIQLLGSINPDQKATFMRLLAEFLELGGSADTVEEKLRNSTRVELAEMDQKVISSKQYSGWAEARLDDDKWRLYFLSIKSDYLLLHENDTSDQFMYSISLTMGKIVQGLGGSIELHHECQSNPIAFRSANPSELKKALLIACSSNIDSPLSRFRKNCVGRLSVTIHTLHNIKISKPPASTVKPLVYVAVDLEPFSCKTKTSAQSEEIHWGQTFIM